MKRMVCASQASTAVCSSMEQVACSSASAVQLGGRALDRHNPIIRDAKRFTKTLPSINPCTSQPPPINPLPYHQLKKNEKKGSSKSNNDARKSSSSVSTKLNDHKKKKKGSNKSSSSKETDTKDAETSRKSFVNGEAFDLVTPPGSTRYLLSDKNNNNNNSGFFDDIDPVWRLVSAETNKIQARKQDEAIVTNSSSSSPIEKPSKDQIVVLRVSLHCKGCEGKVRKHLSRMEGVTSYSIDFKAKKVTIVGDVTPSSVLASVSKVKSAQFWTSVVNATSSTNMTNK